MTYEEKQQKIKELGQMIALANNLSYTKRAKIKELENRLRFRLREIEEQGFEEKIKIMESVLKIIHTK